MKYWPHFVHSIRTGSEPSVRASGCGLPADAGHLLDRSQRPAHPARRYHLLLLLFTQNIAHVDGAYFLRLSQCPGYVLIGRFSGDHHWPVLGDP
jgi:hypothetical protein